MSKSQQYTAVKVKTPPSNTFDLSCDRKFSMNMGNLVPHHLMEVLPGDKISINSNHLIRFAPMLAPIMHMVDVYQHFWYMPNRLVWSNWQDFITAGVDGLDAPPFPYVKWNNFENSSIPDYLGLPTSVGANDSTPISAIPFAMYGKIWNEFYRDQNLQAEIDVDLMDGDNTTLITAAQLLAKPFKRAWTQDYFTSCLPFPQKGPAVTIPLGTTADIIWDAPNDSIASLVRDAATGAPLGPTPLHAGNAPTGGLSTANALGAPLYLDNAAQLKADLSTALSASINDLRLSFAIQGWLELNARTGTRYTEYLRAHWDSFAGDSTLQRPEYLGGSKSPLVISEVLQTSETGAETPQGNMAGHGISTSNANSFTYECKEHGYIMGLISIMPKPAYFQGLHKSWRRFDKFDYYEPMFANLGEQAVKNGELYFKDTLTTDEGTFGYQARWAEYKDLASSVHGDFRTTNLFWTLTREFATQPALNASFIKCDASERIFAVQSLPPDELDHIWCHVHHSIRARRPMPMFGVPSLL